MLAKCIHLAAKAHRDQLDKGGEPYILHPLAVMLTKLDEQTHDEYLQQILSNRDACLVKLADLQHNSDLRRLKGTTQKDLDRVARYTNMYESIKERLENEKD